MGDPRCKWVRDRLPLLAGDELFGTERRRVERHLIGCAHCRAHRASLAQALEVLHAASAEAPVRPDAPTLWPALARQIQESRRSAPAIPWWVSTLTWPRLGLAAGLILALGMTAEAQRQVAGARAQMAIAARPLPALPVRPVYAPAPARVAQSSPVPEAPPPARYDYMLDRGAPMGLDNSDSKTQPSY